MSELSAKHKALNILRVLTAEKDAKIPTSPRPDLTSSQEILAGKYRELAALLATQYVERKTVSRLQSTDLVSRSAGSTPSLRRQHYHGNQVVGLPAQRRRRKVLASSESLSKPEAKLTPCITKSQNRTGSHETDLNQPPNSGLASRKKVSFGDAELRSGSDYASSSTDVSDTEVIRRILRSPRKVTVGEAHPSPPARARRRTVSPVSKKPKPIKPSRKKPDKGKLSPRQTPRRSESPERGSPETAQRKKEFHPSDNKLSSSSNPDVLSWLKEKNKMIRKQKRSERKKERQEKLAEQKAVEEKVKRLFESEEKVAQWMKQKDESLTRLRIQRRVQKDMREREALQHSVTVESNEVSPPKPETASVPKRKIKNTSTKSQKPVLHSKENISGNQGHLDEEARQHLVRNLEAERLLAEEKRQRKEAEKRRKRLLREAQTAKGTKKPDSRLAMSDSKRPTGEVPKETKSDTKSKTTAGGDHPKTMPSSNPFKGLTYDEWLRQKQADQRKQAKEARKQDVTDPELDDLIPLLARRRIEQIKVRATRVDSGLRRSRDPPNVENDKSERPRTPNGVRPYTWSSSTSPSNEKPKPGHSRKGSRAVKNDGRTSKVVSGTKNKMVAPMPDVVNFERPEPQGCEGTETFSCQSSETGQSEETKGTTTDQSRPNLSNLARPSANGDVPIKDRDQSQKGSQQANGSSEAETIFMTQPNTA